VLVVLHDEHALLPCASAYVSTGHAMHPCVLLTIDSAVNAKPSGEYRPMGHEVQSCEPSVENSPGEHGVHAELLLALVYLPASHSAHAVKPLVLV
jgi:hypothetical protein